MSDPVVYLAGPVDAYANGGAEWREKVQTHYGEDFEYRDPLDKYNVRADDLVVLEGTTSDDDPETVGVDELVERDKRYIDEADGVLVGYTAVRSIGTPMEVMYAREHDMPVALWIRDDTEPEELSPWYRYHATAIRRNALMALTHIEGELGADRTEVAPDV